MRTSVAIIGAGPAGMFLAHLLAAEGIDAIVIERRDRAYVEGRVRAGVLEQVTTDLMHRLGLGERLDREGLVHGGTQISLDGSLFRIDMAELTGGSAVTVYGQQEVMHDLFEAAPARGLRIEWNAEDVTLEGLDTDAPVVRWHKDGEAHELRCDFVAGCDGYHGVSRASIPADVLRTFERVYPFGWLGILADVPPADHELIYANHERGFALASMRSATRSRYYIQCGLDESIEDWPDERFWDELCLRIGPEAASRVTRGASFEKSIAPLRSFVSEPMRWGRLFLAGDAAHIVPPTGAKGMNLAVSDVMFLGEALVEHYRGGSQAGLDGYSTRALARVWKAERFSWWFTSITHRFPEMDGFARRIQAAELDYIRGSRAAQRTLAENYVGLPMGTA
ncbi:4-hydroxybenzoate 3-monooxygenase [Novosphingobium resinovorum]|uniref:4-hydroxybenzoate 3-monooxygenase n=1 Tax=Novosphingobium resinovorum TaxID=158500 RepID=A0A031JWF0_9SPHN|nr:MULTISPECIES: 4-hydroxybenzoate 3-monooxygenase [Sphingomonadaceae]AOR79986.1 4-hydroxybenzoate 3-monooxygenase [Novosphingobium resinovorum]EJU09115.1 4-hydroxybenzoate 3-monooxygenase [Sphingomonas sp. LH128]EZP81133.1 4-hydroxybenzoate 3-monooxygenase [Novosphingobium resinovorum]MBF7014877.1 4-hydroxybenzoate 3-monooxygenase [Novosphingobium sp. HR1a]WJM24646.1 4-hydroxybenzoate 3-monooxygenase [Novosphingobium resinovorum]